MTSDRTRPREQDGTARPREESDDGDRLRVLIAILGLDQHEAGALTVSRLLRDHGIEVIYLGRFNLPETVAAVALQEDVDVIGLSCHSWEILYYASDLVARLAATPPRIPVIVGGSVITPADRQRLLDCGVDEAILPTATPAEIVAAFRRLAAGVDRSDDGWSDDGRVDDGRSGGGGTP
jgi:methylmalonyl-CoA mutase C-terminal domain/subunit